LKLATVSIQKTHPSAPDLLDAADDVLDGSDTVVPDTTTTSRRFWLEHRGSQFELRAGTMLIGRSSGCQMVLDDSLVSRRHAQLIIGRAAVKIQDLDSANGVFVNGKRLQGTAKLQVGDRLLIGQQEMTLRSSLLERELEQQTADSGRRYNAETLHGAPVPSLEAALKTVDDSEPTNQGHALELLATVADKVLALGRGDEAEKILANSLQAVQTQSQTHGSLDDDLADLAAAYALKLAQATGKPRWIDYAFDLFRKLKRPLPANLVDDLYRILRNVSGVNLAGLREYTAALKSAHGRFGPTERFLVLRIEGLERILR